MEITKVLGTVAMVPRGEYDYGAYYEYLNVVTYNGSSYMAKMASNGVLPTNDEYWQLCSEKGDKGDKGDEPIRGVDYYTEADKNELEASLSTDVTNEVSTQLDTLTSATPITATSIAGMTDTSRIYVNTSDGHWYWYNGSNWVDGGVYQATGISNNSVSYSNLTELVREGMFKVVTPSDLIWVEGVNRYNGTVNNSNDAVSSQIFLAEKGTVIEASNSSLKSRYTFYNLDGTYIRNTGTYTYRSTYEIQQDCYCCISSDISSLTKEEVAATYSCSCLLPKSERAIKFNYYGSYTNRMESEAFFVTKGTKIKTLDYGIYNSGGNLSDSCAYIGYNKYGKDKKTCTYVNFGQDANYSNSEITIDEDCYIKLYIKYKGSKTVTENDLEIVNNILSIKYVENDKNEFIDTNLYRIYLSNNANSEVLEVSGGKIIYRIIGDTNSIIIKRGNKTLNEITWSDLKTKFSSSITEYNGNDYLSLSSYYGLYFSFFDNDYHLANLNSTEIGTYNLLLLANAYGNIIPTPLYNLCAKKYSSATNIFNSSDYITSSDWIGKATDFSSKMNETNNNIEAYIFFTDPHLMGGSSSYYSDNLNKYIGTLQKVYNSIPANFIVCGGDWLNNGDTPEKACFKLGYVDGFMRSMFNNYYELVGNHDTNYQGTEAISNTTISNLWYRKDKKAYFKFEGINSINYCLDTGKEGTYNAMNNYRWEQISWLAEQLVNDDYPHATVFMHIVWHNSNVEPMADNVTKLIYAYNQHTTITLNNISYDFSECSGHVDYVMSGHTHEDLNDNVNNVLCIATTTFAYGQNQPTFDMVLNDYYNNKVKLIRFGNGSDREFNI